MNETPKYGIGIDVGGTKVWAVLGDEQGTIAAEIQMRTAKEIDSFVAQMHQLIEYLIQKSGVSLHMISGIGIGLPGTVDDQSGIVTWVPNLPFLDGFALSDTIATKWGLPVRLKNDGQLALLGEQWLGAAAGCRNVIMLTLGTGIGGGIMVDGRIWSGHHGTAGSMGWLTLDLDDLGDSNHGWLERMISGTGVNERAGKLSKPLTSRELFETAKAGDPHAMKLVEEIGHTLGTAIANLVSVIDPELVVIGGGLSAQLPSLLPSVTKAVVWFSSPSTRQTRIVPAQLLGSAGMLGALKLSLTS